jgi:hypothetical protein
MEEQTETRYNLSFTTDHGQSSGISNLSREQVSEIIDLKKAGGVYISQDRNDNIMVIDLAKVPILSFTARIY